MIISVILYWLVLLISTAAAGEARPEWQRIPKEAPCLTGYMTDVQSWVGEYGEFTRNVDKNYSIDLSETRNVVKSLEQRLYSTKYSKQHRFKYLSIANSYLTRVPSIFRMEDSYNRRLADTLEFLTVYGNNFGAMDPYSDMYRIDMNATDARELDVSDQFQLSILSQWSTGLHLQTFRSLRELDLRACSIQVVGANTFERMPELRKLYLSENNIYHIDANAFESLKSLRHLDLSRNYAYDQHGNRLPIEYGSLNVFKRLKLLESLDFSYTIFGSRNVGILSQIAKSLTRLSLCNTGLGRLRNITFNTTSIRLLDVSGNNEILSTPEVLGGLEQYLEILYAANVTLRNMDGFRNFSHLEILKLTNNEISTVPEIVAATLTNLKILDLDNNRMTSWPNNTFRAMPRLKLLSLKNNNINIITQNMYFDIEKLSFLGLAGNFLVCNCHARDLYEVASNNELLFNSTTFYSIGEDFVDPLRFHRGFKDYNKVIHERRNITSFCEERETCEVEFNDEVVGNYLLLDYEDYASQYKCLSITEGKSTRLYNVPTCSASTRDITDLDVILSEGWNKYLLLLLPTMLLPFMLCAYVFRKNFKYFLITVRNSAMLSLINKNDSPDDDTIFNYDVFVSYCNEDRAWVLDDLLPHVEKDCNISVCLHERDFQVGLSILENIVSCMDRSRMIMLIISKRFLLSQWCQFEMHLAQHRLLETRREDLILVLLEEIPKRLRPNTLHYLMLTKTYIVWPKEESEQNLFWKRMKKSLVTHKLRSTENVSLA